eukprot:c29627_g1_i1 orf=3-425(-)
MLKIIEEDADSFAKRAEMYYKRRPELLNLVEAFYRAYRALAERYHLTGELHENLPSTLRVEYGLSSESPQSSPVAIDPKIALDEFDPFMFGPAQSFIGRSEKDEHTDTEVSSRDLAELISETESEHDSSKSTPELLQDRET